MLEDTGRRSDSSEDCTQKLPRDEQLLEKKRKRKTKKNDAQERKIYSEKNLGSKILYNETSFSDAESKIERVQSGKSKCFSKIFTDEDDITILEGVIKFKEETGVDSRKNMVKFYDFIIESLSFAATRIQLSEKIRRFNEKYVKHVQSGTTPKTPHELKVFNLCKKIWVELSEPHNMPKTEQLKQPKDLPETVLPKPIIIPKNVMDLQALFDLRKPLIEDLQLIFNAMTRLHGNSNQVGVKQFDLYAQSLRLMQHSPELLEQKVLRSYFEAKLELTQVISNAYSAFIKDHGAAA